MNKLEQALRNKGIIFDGPDSPSFIEEDNCRQLVTIQGNYIVTVYHSAVLPSILEIFDRHTFKLIATQNLYPEPDILTGRPSWDSCYVVS